MNNLFEDNLKAQKRSSLKQSVLEKYSDTIPDIEMIFESMVTNDNVLNIDSDYFIAEMAEIYPDYTNKKKKNNPPFSVCVVEGGEGTDDPHVHIYFDGKDKTNGTNRKDKTVAYISLNSATYSIHHLDDTKIVNAGELKDIIEFFNTYEDDDREPRRTCWESCVHLWLRKYGDPHHVFKKVNGKYVMPDYSNLNINYRYNKNEDPDFPRKNKFD